MKHLAAAMVLCLAAGLAQAKDLETVLGKIDENRAKLDNCLLVVQSVSVQDTTAGRETTSQSTDKLMLFGGMARSESESISKRGDREVTSRSITTWDGKESRVVSLPAAADATGTLSIRSGENKGASYGQLFPSLANMKDATVVETPDRMLRISAGQRVAIVDPAKGFAPVLMASSMSSPLMRGRVFNSVTLYRGYQQSPQGAWYPTEVVGFMPDTLDLDAVTSEIAPPSPGLVTTRKVVKADFKFKGSPELATIQPKEGWRVMDFTRGEGGRTAVSYFYRPGLTDADINRMSEEQKAAAAKQQADALARRKAADDARANLVNNPHPTLASLEFFSGPVKSVKELEGKVVLLDFWATWCGWCTRSLPDIKKWDEKYRDQGFVVLGINSDRNDIATEGKIAAFLEKEGTTHTIALDKDQSVKAAYGVGGIPQFYLIDRDGTVVHALTGFGGVIEGRPGSGEGFKKLEEEIQEALAKPASGQYKSRPLASGPTTTSKAD
ncbi:TlpA family protein disulfide reductase [bacterium]|nr:TlpA family protein disulfide reductase [bacterium]